MVKKISVSELQQFFTAASQLYQKELPTKFAYALTRNIKRAQKELEAVEETRHKILDKYAVKDENGEYKRDEHGQLVLSDQEAAENEYRELLQQEIEMDFHVVPVEALPDTISPALLHNLDVMIDGG